MNIKRCYLPSGIQNFCWRRPPSSLDLRWKIAFSAKTVPMDWKRYFIILVKYIWLFVSQFTSNIFQKWTFKYSTSQSFEISDVEKRLKNSLIYLWTTLIISKRFIISKFSFRSILLSQEVINIALNILDLKKFNHPWFSQWNSIVFSHSMDRS